MRVKTSAAPDIVEKLAAMSPVLDTLQRSVPVLISLDTY
jgi:hypothetical protein